MAFFYCLEDDVGAVNPSQAKFTNVASNHLAFKQVYLDLRVAYKRYKARYVPTVVSEADFNEAGSEYEYNDPWLDKMKKEFQCVFGVVGSGNEELF